MSSVWIWFAHALSRALDPVEREAVLGDFAELRMTDGRALKGMLGLVVRWQVGFWKGWEPWFVLGAVVLPIGPLLGEQSNRLGLGFFPNLVMWFQHGISYRTGVSSAALLAEFCFQATALITWSWASAFALGTLSRRTLWANGVLFLVLCAIFSVYRGLYSVRILWLTPWAWTPIVMNFLVVLLPAYCGLRKSAKSRRTEPRWVIPLAAWTWIIGGLAFWAQGWYDAAYDNWSHGAPALGLFQLAQRADAWEALVSHLFTLALLSGPILYLLAMDTASHRLSRISRA
jgi:hypothetical protein